jgi:uncharacterized phage protein (TIGR01671 family)
MRAIKFRAKDINKKQWCYGSLLTNYYEFDEPKTYSIVDREDYHFPVIPETIGQFTGLCDDNGKDIYEGDVLKVEDSDYYCFVRWDIDFAAFVAVRFQHGSHFFCGYNLLDDDLPSDTQLCVIGNIHDNPELIK